MSCISVVSRPLGAAALDLTGASFARASRDQDVIRHPKIPHSPRNHRGHLLQRVERFVERNSAV